MTRITGNVRTIETDYGWIRVPLFEDGHVIGDRLVPSIIEVDFPGAGGQPALYMVIEVIDKVPRLTELTFRRVDGGREVRAKDLELVKIDDWVETFVAMVSGVVTRHEGGKMTIAYKTGPEHVREGLKVISEARKGSRRPITDQVLRDVAEIYNAQDKGGIEAVQRAFGFSRSTAVRRINKATDAGYISKGKR